MEKFNVVIFCAPSVPGSKTRNYGSHRIASHIRENGYSCLVVDFCTALDWNTYQEILKLSVGENTLMVGFSTTFMPSRVTELASDVQDSYKVIDQNTGERKLYKADDQISSTLTDDIAFGKGAPWLNLIKEINPNIKIVFGGTAISYYMDYNQVDNFIYGLSENMIVDYLDSLSKKGPKRIFNRVLDYDSKAQDPKFDFRKSTTKYTAYDLITATEPLSLEVSRGCRFKCKFCSYPLIGQKNMNDYTKFENSLYSELMENYNKWGVTKYFIVDDTFNDSTEKLLLFKKVLDALPFKIKFWCFLRAEILVNHPEQISLLKEMGLYETFFGIETFHQAAGKAIGKGMDPNKIKSMLSKCKEVWGNDVHITAGFIVGLPFEPEESIIETVNYLRDPKCPIDQGWLHPLSIINSKGNDPRLTWIYKSEYDKNYDKYGYYFNPPKELMDLGHWYKEEDGSGIYSVADAIEVANRHNQFLPVKAIPGELVFSSLDHPVLSDIEITKKMSISEYKELLKSLDLKQLYLDTVNSQYFTPLIKKLKYDFRLY